MDNSTKWSSSDEATLIDTLLKARDEGLQSENGWKPTAYTLAEQALEGSEVMSGGVKKTLQPIKTRWQRVSVFSCLQCMVV